MLTEARVRVIIREELSRLPKDQRQMVMKHA